MADNKWSEQKEDHVERKTKRCQSKRKISEMERTFQESYTHVQLHTHKHTHIYSWKNDEKFLI